MCASGASGGHSHTSLADRGTDLIITHVAAESAAHRVVAEVEKK
jgi:hypothetical protein